MCYSKYVLVSPETATDADYVNVARVIAHEYFHNWRGDRITCRDWFQIALKEGFTSFCEQGYVAARFAKISQRISDVRIILEEQFAEDASPMVHPVRPASYIEVNNFYTVTVYNKGAEVVRMLQTLLGKKLFRAATDLFFSKFDGQAVTIEDFLSCAQEAAAFDLYSQQSGFPARCARREHAEYMVLYMSSANERSNNAGNLSAKSIKQFMHWYTQAGTVILNVSAIYDAVQKTFTLHIEQISTNKNNAPFYIPFVMGLLDKNGKDLTLRMQGEESDVALSERVLHIKNRIEEFCFINIPDKPVPSLLRNFSAPVKLNYVYTQDELRFLMSHDSDELNRWNAAQQLIANIILNLLHDYNSGKNYR